MTNQDGALRSAVASIRGETDRNDPAGILGPNVILDSRRLWNSSVGRYLSAENRKNVLAVSGSGAFLIENRAMRLLQVSRESDPLAMTIAHSHHSPEIDLLQRDLGIDSAISYGSIGLNVGLICESLAPVPAACVA